MVGALCLQKTRKLLRLFPTEKDRDAIGQVLVKAGEENAGVIDVGDGWGVAFKIESHNHPSAIEPLKVRLPVWGESYVIFSQWALDPFF